jgi:hypothetical protein
LFCLTILPCNLRGKWSWGQISWDRNRRSNVSAIMRLNFFVTFNEVEISNYDWISWSRHFSWDRNSKKALLGNLLVASTIMRSKFKINYLNLVSYTCYKFLALIISHLCIKTFDLMIVHLRLTDWSWDQNSLIMLYFNFDLMIDLLAARTIMRSKL